MRKVSNGYSWMAVLLTLLLCLQLTGCGSGAGAPSAGEQGGAEVSSTEQQADAGQAAESTAEQADTGENQAEESAAGPADTAAPEEAVRNAYAVVEPAQARVGVILEDAWDDDRAEYRGTLLKALSGSGFPEEQITILDGDDREDRLTAVNNLLETGVDLLIIEAGDEKAGQETLDEEIKELTDVASKSWVPVIFVCSAPSEKEQLRWKFPERAAVYVGNTRDGTGRDQALLVASLGRKNRDLDNDAVLRYVYVGKGTERDEENFRAFSETLKKKGIHGECIAKIKDKKGWKTELKDELDRNGKALEMVVCCEDDMAEDVPEIARSADRKPGKNLVIIGADAEDDVLELIIRGEVTGTVYRDVYTECYAVAGAAVKLCSMEIPETVSIPGVSVTAANAQEIRDYRESFLKTEK